MSARALITKLRSLLADVHVGLIAAGWRNDSLVQRVKALAPVNGDTPWPMPLIVCLCGSTRFSVDFQNANLEETLAGHIVLSIGCDTKCDDALDLPIGTKAMLDELHLRKIDLADEVIVLNRDGYVGESTRREIRHAHVTNKPIRWLMPEFAAKNLTEATGGAS